MSCDSFAPEDDPKTNDDMTNFVQNIMSNIGHSSCATNIECATVCSNDLLSDKCISCTSLQTNCDESTACLTCLASNSGDVNEQGQCARDINIGLSTLSIALIIVFTIVGVLLAILVPIGISRKWGHS
jgi:hypothetical protein